MSLELRTVSLPELQSPPEDTYCRLCLSITETEFRNVFLPFNSLQTIAQAVEDLAKVEISLEDHHSKLICLGCFQKLNSVEDFKTIIENSDFRLKNQFTTEELLEEDESSDHESFVEENTDQYKIDIDEFDLDGKVVVKDEIQSLDSSNLDAAKCAKNVVESGRGLDKEKGEIKVKKKRREGYCAKCPDCGKTFASDTGYNAHILVHTGEYPLRCSFCQKGFLYKAALLTHEAIHKAETPYTCEICGKGFKTNPSLLNHKTIHSEPAFKCDKCDKIFTRKQYLKEHQVLHLSETPFKCEICHRKYKSAQQLSHHTGYAHKRGNRIPCPICGKLLPSLVAHLKRHTKPFKCDICEQSFGSRTILRNHAVIHTGEKSYKCTICHKTFNHSASLRNHHRIHDTVKRFPCDLCDKKFNYKHHLQTHVQKVHQKDNC